MDPGKLLRAVEWVAPRVHAVKRRFPAGTQLIDMVVPVSNHPDPEWRVLDTFDWYSPRYQWKHTYREVERWFRDLRFQDVRRGRVPVSIRGRRPAAESP
jgi:hypothetical protein